MAGYWRIVPKGTWRVQDSEDALAALKDPESRARVDNRSKRIDVYGPFGKALIIDLEFILLSLGDEGKTIFIGQVEELTGEVIRF